MCYDFPRNHVFERVYMMYMKRTETVTLTNLCMIRRGDQVLAQDKVGSDYRGFTFPGGHVERGESLTDAVIREVREETGLTIVSPTLCGVKDWQEEDGTRYLVLCYRADRFSGELTSSAEGEVRWMDLSQLMGGGLAPGMDSTLSLFLDETLSECFFSFENGVWVTELK